MGVSRYDPRWVAPFGDPRIKAWLAAPRGLSQLPHVLHCLLMPRHPPDTLSSLGNIFRAAFSTFGFVKTHVSFKTGFECNPIIDIAVALPRILGQLLS